MLGLAWRSMSTASARWTPREKMTRCWAEREEVSIRSARMEGDSQRTHTAQDPVMAADSRAINVVLHFILLELLPRTDDGVYGRRRKLVRSWMAGPRSRYGRKEGTPILMRRTQARLLVGLSIMSARKL